MWTKEQFLAWKDSPQTKGFLAFLRERRDELAADWADGKTMTAHEQSMAQAFGDIAGFEYDRDIAPHYEKQEQEKESDDG